MNLKFMKLGQSIIAAQTGEVVKNNALTSPRLDLAFVKVGGSEIAITPNTKLKGYNTIKDLKLGTTVGIDWKKTSRGLEAVSVRKV